MKIKKSQRKSSAYFMSLFVMLSFILSFNSTVYGEGSLNNAEDTESIDQLQGPKDVKEIETFADKFFTESMKKSNVPGAAIVIVRDGNVILKKGYGYEPPLGCGSINSTVVDMANFMIVNLQKGKFYDNQILNENTSKLMQKQHFTNSTDLPGMEYGFIQNYNLRTPLTSVLGYLELIENKKYTDEVHLQHYVDIAYKKCTSLKSLIVESLK